MSKYICKYLLSSRGEGCVKNFAALFTFFLPYVIITENENAGQGEAEAIKIIKLAEGDKLGMKKPHPCGSAAFTVLRVGSDIRIKCEGCGRDVTVARIKIEKNIKTVNGEKV